MYEYVSQRAKYLVGVIYDYFEKQFFPIKLVVAAVLPISKKFKKYAFAEKLNILGQSVFILILARFFTG